MDGFTEAEERECREAVATILPSSDQVFRPILEKALATITREREQAGAAVNRALHKACEAKEHELIELEAQAVEVLANFTEERVKRQALEAMIAGLDQRCAAAEREREKFRAEVDEALEECEAQAKVRNEALGKVAGLQVDLEKARARIAELEALHG